MPAADGEALRAELVSQLVAAGCVRTAAVERAFRVVPRDLFVPGQNPAAAYRNEAIVTRRDDQGRPTSSSSQPAIMALMLEQLALRPGHRVLELGAGTGYNAALMAQLVGPTGSVVTVDIDPEVAGQARTGLDEAGYRHVLVVNADGAAGYPAGAPYDRIIATVGVWDLAPPWIEQLTGGGRLVVPLSLRGMQRSVAFDRDGDRLVSASIVACGFMPMRGTLAEPNGPRLLDRRPGVFVRIDDRHVNTAAISAALGHPDRLTTTGVRVTAADVAGGLGLWLVLRDPGVGTLAALDTAVDPAAIPAVVVHPGMSMTVVVLAEQALAALVSVERPPDAHDTGFELGVRGYGPDSEPLVDRLAGHIRDWAAHGRPSTSQLRISAYPRHTEPPGGTVTVIDKPHTTLILEWEP